MLTSHDVILGIQTADVTTSKYAILGEFFLAWKFSSFKNVSFVFSGDIFSSHLKINSILLFSIKYIK